MEQGGFETMDGERTGSVREGTGSVLEEAARTARKLENRSFGFPVEWRGTKTSRRVMEGASKEMRRD